MTVAMTYSSLIDDLATYVERNDNPFLSQRPNFISLAENRLAMEVRGLGLQKYVTGTLNGNTLPKPERWRETISFSILSNGERVYLQNRSYDFCRSYNPTNATGVPRFYADYEYEHYFISPTPNAAFPFELAYYERPEPLSDQNQTNYYTQYCPQLLLYGSLLEAQPFLKRPERIQEFQALYDRAMQGLSQESNRRVNADRAGTARNGE
jgi:hypothetical protein